MAGEELLHPDQFRYLISDTGVLALRAPRPNPGVDRAIGEVARQSNPTAMVVDYSGKKFE